MKNDSNSTNNKNINMDNLRDEIVSGILTIVLKLIRECYESGMPINFLYEQIAKLKESYKN